VLQEVANFFKGHGVGDFTFSRGRLSQWRCRAKLAVRGTPENPLIGLYQDGTHVVTDIPECRAHHPSINAAVKLLRQGISELNIQPYDEDAGTGELRYVQVIVNFLEVTNNHMKKLYVFLGPALYSTREFVTSNIECRYHRV